MGKFSDRVISKNPNAAAMLTRARNWFTKGKWVDIQEKETGTWWKKNYYDPITKNMSAAEEERAETSAEKVRAYLNYWSKNLNDKNVINGISEHFEDLLGVLPKNLEAKTDPEIMKRFREGGFSVMANAIAGLQAATEKRDDFRAARAEVRLAVACDRVLERQGRTELDRLLAMDPQESLSKYWEAKREVVGGEVAERITRDLEALENPAHLDRDVRTGIFERLGETIENFGLADRDPTAGRDRERDRAELVGEVGARVVVEALHRPMGLLPPREPGRPEKASERLDRVTAGRYAHHELRRRTEGAWH
jgi:hypothetical protein